MSYDTKKIYHIVLPHLNTVLNTPQNPICFWSFCGKRVMKILQKSTRDFSRWNTDILYALRRRPDGAWYDYNSNHRASMKLWNCCNTWYFGHIHLQTVPLPPAFLSSICSHFLCVSWNFHDFRIYKLVNIMSNIVQYSICLLVHLFNIYFLMTFTTNSYW